MPNPAKKLLEYAVVIERDGDGYSAHFPDLPGCFTQGGTIREIRANAREAVELYVQVLRDRGQPIPRPTAKVERVAVRAS